jgi:hypothetical protein
MVQEIYIKAMYALPENINTEGFYSCCKKYSISICDTHLNELLISCMAVWKQLHLNQ